MYELDILSGKITIESVNKIELRPTKKQTKWGTHSSGNYDCYVGEKKIGEIINSEDGTWEARAEDHATIQGFATYEYAAEYLEFVARTISKSIPEPFFDLGWE
ncbi:hypothetical protein ACX27_04155 [Nostoc piscinale CENA21]|uniref:Uncharacterized protein n=1 Tax=Nostoc piscinale CENA21 TaxID=224013 RepID=A0A0M4TU78_9NOSO|nr:hypothetical protein [Nostoc piscinale]ALF52226.1 hypothetical protein ACX27_04155 [Nostoc piscinale CENA21]